MKLISINIGEKRTLRRKDHIETTGIFKIPTTEPARIGKLGMEGDVIISKKHHGGPDQAIYVYGTADYDWWSKELRQELPPGTFGDNLTISELESAPLNIGDYLHVGEVTLQVTAPRIPCSTFAARMEDSQWVKKFHKAERPGLYCRVLKEGVVETGEAVTVEKYTDKTLSVQQMFHDYYDRHKSEENLRLHLKAPIAIRAREDLEEELRHLLTAKTSEAR